MLKITVRSSVEADFPAIKAFIDTYQHEYNARRDDATLLAMIKRRYFLLFHVSIPPVDTAETLVAVSGLFEHGDEGQWIEAGATRVILNGFGLQRLATDLRALTAVVTNSDLQEIFATVVDGNATSRANLEACGFEPWTPPQALVEEKKRLHSGMGAGSRVVDYFHLPGARLPEKARRVLEMADNGRTLHRKARHPADDTEARLVFEADAVTFYREALEELATGHLSR